MLSVLLFPLILLLCRVVPMLVCSNPQNETLSDDAWGKHVTIERLKSRPHLRPHPHPGPFPNPHLNSHARPLTHPHPHVHNIPVLAYAHAHARYQLHAITVIAVAVAVVMIVVIVVVILILTFFVVVIVILNFVIDSSVAIWVKSVCFAICAICQSPRMPAQRL